MSYDFQKQKYAWLNHLQYHFPTFLSFDQFGQPLIKRQKINCNSPKMWTISSLGLEFNILKFKELSFNYKQYFYESYIFYYYYFKKVKLVKIERVILTTMSHMYQNRCAYMHIRTFLDTTYFKAVMTMNVSELCS